MKETATQDARAADEAILQRIQSRIRQAYSRTPPHPGALRHAKLFYPGKPADIPYDTAFYQHLESTRRLLPAYDHALQLGPNKLARIPLLGKLFQKAQTGLHQIALFYVIRAQRHQLEVNRRLQESVERLLVENQKQQRLIMQLREQTAARQTTEE